MHDDHILMLCARDSNAFMLKTLKYASNDLVKIGSGSSGCNPVLQG